MASATEMAAAAAQSNAKRILLPFNHCDNIVVGISDYNVTAFIQDAVAKVSAMTVCKAKS